MSSSLSTTIMEFLRSIFGDEEARAAFLRDPEGYLADNGLDDLSCADFDDALVSFFDNSRAGDYNLGGNFENTVARSGQSDSEAISEHLTKIVHQYGDTYITNNDNDVVNDSSFNGFISAGGDVNFDNGIVSASGPGSIAAGGDISGPTNTGSIDANQSGINFGNGNTATGGSNTTQDNVGNDYSDNSQDNVGNDYSDRSRTDNSDNSQTDNSDNSLDFRFEDSSDNSQTDNSTNTDNSDNSTNDSDNTSVAVLGA